MRNKRLAQLLADLIVPTVISNAEADRLVAERRNRKDQDVVEAERLADVRFIARQAMKRELAEQKRNDIST